MKRRYAYCFLYGLPGLFISLIVAVFSTGAAAGVLWLFVFGDNPWPSWVDVLLPVQFGAVFLAVWIWIIVMGFRVGKAQEAEPDINRRHLFTSLGLTAAALLFIIMRLAQMQRP